MNAIPTNNNINNVIDLDLSATAKKQFRFDKDDSRIVFIDTADMRITNRFSDTYPKLQELVKKAYTITDGIEAKEDKDEASAIEDINSIATRLDEVDTEMRYLIDELFDAPVSAAAAPVGSMYDIFNGEYRFEHIIAVVINQYSENISQETKKMQMRMKQHTAKYQKGNK